MTRIPAGKQIQFRDVFGINACTYLKAVES